MSKVVVSVSMDSDLAQILKTEALDNGESFSALVSRAVITGRTLSQGLISDTTAKPFADRLGMLELPEDEEEMPVPELKSDGRSAKELVYSCLTGERQALVQIAEDSGVSEEEVGNILDALANAGEPVILRVVDGVWFCWEERA